MTPGPRSSLHSEVEITDIDAFHRREVDVSAPDFKEFLRAGPNLAALELDRSHETARIVILHGLTFGVKCRFGACF